MAVGTGYGSGGFTGGGGGGGGGIGPPGPPGPTGPQGPAGATGAQGPAGPQGPIGPQGPVGPVTEIKGSVPTSGALPPSGNAIGDAYITEDTGHLWVWNGTNWVDAGMIVGPPGPTGAQGPIGATGPPGVTGPQGPAGPTGGTGATGAQGPAGPQGPVGPQGPAGAADLSGVLAGTCISITPSGTDIIINAAVGCIQTPWIQPVNAANNAIYNLPVVQFAPTGQIYPSSAAGNAMIVWGGTGGVLLRAPAGVSTSGTFVPAYPLDVVGNVNSSGCYLIGGVAFACSDGAGGVALSNISTINGSAPGSGGTPAPPNQSVQWNNNGALGGSANLTYNDTNVALSMTHGSLVTTLTQSQFSGLAINAQNGGSIYLYGNGVISSVTGSYTFTSSFASSPTNVFSVQTSGSISALDVTAAGNVGIRTGGAAYPLDVAGDVNSTGCYRINGNAFACSDGASGINLSNISAINGSAPGGGAVASVFGRTGAVTAQSGDYNATLITLSPQVSSWTTVQAAIAGLNTSLSSVVSSQWVNGSGGAIYYNGGDVGIGTASPQGALSVVTSSVTDNFRGISSSQYNDGPHSACLWLVKGRGSLASPSPVQVGDFIGHALWEAVSSDGTMANSASIFAVAESVGAGAVGADLAFATAAPGQVNPVERMRITSAGNVGIGTASPTDPLVVNGAIRVLGPAISTNAANSFVIDENAGNARLLSWGPNTTTLGGFQFISLHSDGSGTAVPMVITPSGILGVGTGQASQSGDLAVGRPSAPQTGAIYFGANGTTTGYIYFNGSTWAISPPFPASGGGPTVQSVVTGSRAMGGTYQNTTGKPLYVNVGLSVGTSGFGWVYCDASPSPGTQVGRFNGIAGASFYFNVFFIVLPNYYYRVFDQNSATTILDWVEYY